jgi:hypothetical protein
VRKYQIKNVPYSSSILKIYIKFCCSQQNIKNVCSLTTSAQSHPSVTKQLVRGRQMEAGKNGWGGGAADMEGKGNGRGGEGVGPKMKHHGGRRGRKHHSKDPRKK